MYHIVASFFISPDVSKPKIAGIRTGYSPHHKFSVVNYLVSGAHQYDDDDLHYPGEILRAKIAFPSWEYFRDKVSVGDSFDVLELDRVVGHGKVEEIL